MKQQLLLILGQVNRARKKASIEPLPYSLVLKMKRDKNHPFGSSNRLCFCSKTCPSDYL